MEELVESVLLPFARDPSRDPTMALSVLEQSTINRAIALARKMLQECKELLEELDVAYNAAGTGCKFTITQANLDANAALSGLTKTQLDDGVFALMTVKGDVATSQSQLTQLSIRG